MSTSVFWTLPTRQLDAKLRTRRAPGITDPRPGRFGPYDHLTQVARAAEATGFSGLFIPYDPLGEDSWIVATTLAREVPRLQLLPEFQPGFATAVYTAKLALSFQRFFADRLSWKLALRTDPSLQAAVGDLSDAPAARQRADELLTIVDGVWHSSPFSFTGEHFEVEAGGFFEGVADAAGGFTIARHPRPEVYLDGSSDADLDLSARWGDVHVFDTVDPVVLRGQIARLACRAAQHGREVRVALRLGVVARERDDEAWRDARRLFAEHDGSEAFEELRGEGLRWSGFDRLGASVSDGLVGSFDDLADELAHFQDLGVSAFLLEGTKHLEDVYHLGEFLLPNIVGGRASRALEPQP